MPSISHPLYERANRSEMSPEPQPRSSAWPTCNRSNKDASHALGITVQAFSRLCRQHGTEIPYKRHLRSRRRFADAAG